MNYEIYEIYEIMRFMRFLRFKKEHNFDILAQDYN